MSGACYIWSEDVIECLQESGAEILLVPNGSPFEDGKDDVRLQLSIARVVESGLPLVYLNQVGGQDELVFDGASFVLNADRSLAHRLGRIDLILGTQPSLPVHAASDVPAFMNSAHS